MLTGAPEQSLRLAMLLDLGGSGQNTKSFGGGIGSGSHIVVSRDEQISRMRGRICYNGKLKETDGFRIHDIVTLCMYTSSITFCHNPVTIFG